MSRIRKSLARSQCFLAGINQQYCRIVKPVIRDSPVGVDKRADNRKIRRYKFKKLFKKESKRTFVVAMCIDVVLVDRMPVLQQSGVK
ncbi:MAG: hypothetical protein WA782_20240 [Sulfitobacter sp.]